MKHLTLVLFAVGGILLGLSFSSLYSPKQYSLAAETTLPGSANSDGMKIQNVLLLNQLFNKGKDPLPSNRTLKFSDLAVLNKLFIGQTGEILSNSNFKLGELLVLNQLFNRGKPLSQLSYDDEKNLLFWYLVLTR